MPPADLLFDGGAIWTGAAPTDAVAVTGDRIVALGEQARHLRGSGTEVVPLTGGTLLPAFRDGHIHVLDGGVESLACDLTDAADIDEVFSRLQRYAEQHPGDGWILGYSYPPEILPRGIGHASVLDLVVRGRPVALWSGDHHMVWCNSLALDVAGITSTTPDPPRGTVVRDHYGRPVGTLLEAAEELLEPHLPARTTEDDRRGLEAGLERLAAAGIAFAQEASTPVDRLPVYLALAADGGLTADLDLALRLEPDGWAAQLATFEEARSTVEHEEQRRSGGTGSPGRITCHTVKIFLDGVIEGGTGALLEPYADAPHSHGIANWELPALVEAATSLDAAGFELHMHAIGDAAVRMALDTVAAIREANGVRERRPVTAHTHLVHPDDRPRFAALGVVANFEPLWAQPNGVMVELTEPRLGPERSRWQYPFASLLRSGARVSFGSDWPVSSPVPLEGIAVAVSRQTPDGDPPGGWLADERLTLDQALRAYTAGTADQAGHRDRGTIAVGQRADLTMVEGELGAIEGRDLAGLSVTGTWLAGRRVWPQPDGVP